jgi:hypothetical protein
MTHPLNQIDSLAGKISKEFLAYSSTDKIRQITTLQGPIPTPLQVFSTPEALR